jgi:hypothetical protein
VRVSEPDDPSSSQVDVPTASELQRAIASVPGVATAVVTPTEDGRDRLRISLRPGEDPEAVAWSVAATLRERFGIALDPAAITARVVDAPAADAPAADAPAADAPAADADTGRPGTADVGQPGPDVGQPGPDVGQPGLGADRPSPHDLRPEAAAVAATAAGAVDLAAVARHAFVPPEEVRERPNRAAIRELTAHPDGTALVVAATLGLAGREATGRARGVRTRRGRWRAIAEATLAALDGLVVGRVEGHIDHVTVLTFADLAQVSVSVTLLTERGEETFLGAALVRDDADRAVMRAALDAVNRRIEPWLADAPAEAG